MPNAYRVYRYDHLDAPVVTAGSGAVLIGAQSGLFPAMGHAVPGEMGGLWAGEKKVCDGFFLAIDDVPLTVADACEAQPAATAFHYRMQAEGLHVIRRQFIPDGVGGCVIELTLENLRNAPRMAEIAFTVRTEILTVAAAHGEDGLELGRDVGEYDAQTQAFYARDSRNPWHAVWGAQRDARVLQADLPRDIYGFGNTPGKGINGRLFYRLRLAARGMASMRLFVAGGFASRSRAEDALEALRDDAEQLAAQKQTRIERLMAQSAATLPDESLARCWNWARLYDDWLTRWLPRGGVALCVDLPEHPMLYGEGWAQAMGAILPLGGAERVQQMLRTLVRVSAEAQLAPGRLAREVTPDGRVKQAGGPKESAQFVSLVHRTLLWGGGAAFAREMLAETGLCLSYLRRSTRGFADVRQDIEREVREALTAQAAILRAAGEDDAACLADLERLGELPETPLAPDAPPEVAAMWHGARGHVEQMVACLLRMAASGADGLPGALRSADAAPGVLLESKAAAGFVWPVVTHLFGLAPDAGQRLIVWQPHTPIGWDGWSVERMVIGGARVDVRSERVSPSQARYMLRIDEPDWRVVVTVDGQTQTLPVDGEIALVMED